MNRMFVGGVLILSSLFGVSSWVKTEYGISYPVLKDPTQRAFTANAFRELGVRWFRTDISWKFIESKKGERQWTPDEKIQWAKKNDFKSVLTLSADGPEWAVRRRNQNSAVFIHSGDFRIFTIELAKRYAGMIDIIQFGNEWQTPHWFLGTPQEFVEHNNILYSAFKQHSPATKFCLGGFSIGALRILALHAGKIEKFLDDGTGKAYLKSDLATLDEKSRAVLEIIQNRTDFVLQNALFDMIDIHLYDDPENWRTYYEMILERSGGKPVLVTEFGGPNLGIQPYNETFHVTELKRYLDAMASLGTPLALHFYMIDGDALHGKSSFFRVEGKDAASPSGYKVVKKKTWQVFKDFLPTQTHESK